MVSQSKPPPKKKRGGKQRKNSKIEPGISNTFKDGLTSGIDHLNIGKYLNDLESDSK